MKFSTVIEYNRWSATEWNEKKNAFGIQAVITAVEVSPSISWRVIVQIYIGSFSVIFFLCQMFARGRDEFYARGDQKIFMPADKKWAFYWNLKTVPKMVASFPTADKGGTGKLTLVNVSFSTTWHLSFQIR